MGNFWEGDNRVDTASHGVQLLAHIQNFLYTYVSSYGYPLLRGCGTGVAGCRAHGVVVSHPLRMRKALGSIPSVSIWYATNSKTACKFYTACVYFYNNRTVPTCCKSAVV